MQTVHFDPELIRRYDLRGPRYTSYPTAVQFSESFGVTKYQHAVRSSNEYPIPESLSLYIHLPFCASPCFFCACNRVITRQKKGADAYQQRLFREIEIQATLFDRDREVEQLHLGGGTPTFFSMKQLNDLMEVLRRHFNLRNDAMREFSIEIDPRTVEVSSLSDLGKMGFNRLSMGIQDFDEGVQKAVNRVQDKNKTLTLIDKARDCGFESVSVDLIYGLPNQNTVRFSKTLDAVISARPDRVAAYSYAHLPHVFKAQRQINAQLLPSAEEKLALMKMTIESLTGAGYIYIGMDHFALPDDELVRARKAGSLHRNFQGYSTRSHCDLVGLGVSSIGNIGDTYSQNARTLEEYYIAIDAGHLAIRRGLIMSEDDLIRREAIRQLMCQGKIIFSDFAQATGVTFDKYFTTELKQLGELEQDQLIELDTESIRVTPRGRLLLRVIAMKFDRYIDWEANNAKRFSRTI